MRTVLLLLAMLLLAPSARAAAPPEAPREAVPYVTVNVGVEMHALERAAEDTARATEELAAWLAARPDDASAEAIQNEVYEIGKRHGFANLRDWFGCLYQVLLGQEKREFSVYLGHNLKSWKPVRTK